MAKGLGFVLSASTSGDIVRGEGTHLKRDDRWLLDMHRLLRLAHRRTGTLHNVSSSAAGAGNGAVADEGEPRARGGRPGRTARVCSLHCRQGT
jgi:hypothetical protein